MRGKDKQYQTRYLIGSKRRFDLVSMFLISSLPKAFFHRANRISTNGACWFQFADDETTSRSGL